MRKRIFIRILLLSLFCVVTVFGAGAVAVRKSSADAVRERLRAEVGLLATLLRDDDSLDAIKAYETDEALRVTVFREDGTVLCDSGPSDAGEQFDACAEITAALAGKPTLAERYSQAAGAQMLCYAEVTETAGGERVVLRVMTPNRERAAFFRVAVPFLIVAVLVSLALSAVFAGRMSKGFSERIEGVAESLRALENGEYKPIVPDRREPEYDAVIWEINELNKKTYAMMEAQVAEREKLATVLDIVAQGIVALDSAFRVVFANRSALKLFGGDEKNVGMGLFGLLRDDVLCRRINEYAGGGSFEYRYGERQLVVTLRAITDHALAREIAQIVIVTDVTDARDIAKEKSDFFANASHELKTPITVTLGLSELILAKDGVDESVRAQVERIHKEASRMSELITDMLRLSRLEQHGEVKREPVNLRAIADEVIAELNPRIAEKGLTVTVSGEGTVQAAPERMYELLTNLCSNAVNYNVDGGRLEVAITEQDGHTVLAVRDTGIGIPKEHISRVCERFYRVDKSRSKKTGGTGLGLAIVKHICVLYGAELKIESTVGQGTVVTVTF
ncbi:MAG TPA: hypothetical protein DDW30_08095 [Clostridiales bacterium]|nr:hypothetical protein [Clostridiales bacterium]